MPEFVLEIKRWHMNQKKDKRKTSMVKSQFGENVLQIGK